MGLLLIWMFIPLSIRTCTWALLTVELTSGESTLVVDTTVYVSHVRGLIGTSFLSRK